jgi:DNA polymerase-3 subunit alpha
VVSIKGRTDAREDTVKLIASDITVLNTDVAAPRGPVVVTLPTVRCTPPVVGRLKEILLGHPGPTAVHLRLTGREERVVCLDGFAVRVSPALMAELKPLLGSTAISA